MRPESSEIEEHQIGEIEYLLQYKRIRRMYLRLKPQESKVFVTAPYRTPLSEVEQFVSRNREWIRRQKEKQEQMAPKPVRQYVTGEEVYPAVRGRSGGCLAEASHGFRETGKREAPAGLSFRF